MSVSMDGTGTSLSAVPSLDAGGDCHGEWKRSGETECLTSQLKEGKEML